MSTTATNFNRLTMKALMLDTITHLKTGHHIHPQYKSAKAKLCQLSGQPSNISSRKLITLIGLCYEDNKLVDEFWKTIDKFDAEKFVIQG